MVVETAVIGGGKVSRAEGQNWFIQCKINCIFAYQTQTKADFIGKLTGKEEVAFIVCYSGIFHYLIIDAT